MRQTHHHNAMMQLAITKAWEFQGRTYPNPAVGALVTYHGEIVAIEAHQKAGSSHAEVLALIEAYKVISGASVAFDTQNASASHTFLRALPQGFFTECVIYVTLEPCSHQGKTPSCASLLASLHLKEIIIGTHDPIAGHDGGAKHLSNVTFGIEQEACKTLIEPFLIWQKRAFVLFKIAQSTNGRIATTQNEGYLSSPDSLTDVHHLRSACSLLLIGGHTVREDRPTLDCRFVSASAPHIQIYSHQKKWDNTIPLFGVPQREVTMSDDLSFLEIPSFVLVEGGEGMLNALKEKIDWILFYQTPKLSSHPLGYSISLPLEFLHQNRKGVDLRVWSRVESEIPL